MGKPAMKMKVTIPLRVPAMMKRKMKKMIRLVMQNLTVMILVTMKMAKLKKKSPAMVTRVVEIRPI